MNLVMYFMRAPRHENIAAKDIKLMESYFDWQHEKEIGSVYASPTFEKWCGHSENELPSQQVIESYKSFYTLKTMYTEGIGNEKRYSIFEQLDRYTNTFELYNWFVKHIVFGAPNGYYEVSKGKLEQLLYNCEQVKKGFKYIGKNWLDIDDYSVDISLAREFFPLMTEKAYFGDDKVYGTRYAQIILRVIETVKSILSTTDFEKQAIYVTAFTVA